MHSTTNPDLSLNSRGKPLSPYKPSQLVNFFSVIYNISEELKQTLKGMITEESYKRGEFLVREGEICDKMYYIKKGATRSYIKHNKQEITTYISVENEFETSVSSFFSGKPSRENIEVLEPCQLEVLYKKDLHFLYEKFSETNVIVRIILEEYYQAAEERAYMARVGTAVEKYQYLIDTRGHFLNRIPLKHLASFLSMRLETLSRLRTKHYRNRTENKFSESADSDTDH